METCNPIQGRLRGRTDAALVLLGIDEKYKEASQLGTMRITYEPTGEPLARRVGRHLRGLQAIINASMESAPEKRVVLGGLPEYEQILRQGVGAFLQ
jgi:hypothetical protein